MKFLISIGLATILLGCGQNDSTQKTSVSESATPAIKNQTTLPKPTIGISGQVFVVTKGRENIKLALVEVAAISESVMIEYVKSIYATNEAEYKTTLDELTQNSERRKRVISKAQKEFRTLTSTEYKKATSDQIEAKELLKKVTYIANGGNYFEKLPASIAVSKTDADGKFKFLLPVGRYVFAARDGRVINGSESEYYYWLVLVDTASQNRSLMLSNDNLFITSCNDCLQPKKYADQVAK